MATVVFDLNQFETAYLVDCGCDLMRQNDFVGAIPYFEEALRLDPKDYFARWNRVIALLSLGDYINGMPEHDSAWDNRPFDYGLTAIPPWKGERCRLICYDNMGFGDAILNLRFLSEVVARCESVTLIVKPELVRLMSGRGARVVDRPPEDISVFDARISLFNTMAVMGFSKERIPSKPYIKRDFKFTGGKMGIAWSGTTRKELDLNSFLSRLNTDGFDLYALQKSESIDTRVCPLLCNDFNDTADLMATLDCIVTVDTAAANLAGAIGHPNTHVVLPYMRDWRWWNKDVWYPTLNIYPQESPDDWDIPFRKLNEALKNGSRNHSR